MAQLEARERIIIDLFFRENLSAQDVASILHLSVGAVYPKKKPHSRQTANSIRKGR
jgi:DNA-directed RNA polymerase specialized sigma subunit